jgi:hypothetical protein
VEAEQGQRLVWTEEISRQREIDLKGRLVIGQRNIHTDYQASVAITQNNLT